jgi:hypothetical protein
MVPTLPILKASLNKVLKKLKLTLLRAQTHISDTTLNIAWNEKY